MVREYSLEHSKQDPAAHEAAPALDKARAGHHNSPRCHDKADPLRRLGEPDEDGICRDLEQDIWDKEHHIGKVVVCSLHVEVGFQSFNLSISQVSSAGVS